MITIQFARGQVAIIDDIDADLAELKWHAAKHFKTFYAMREIRRPDGTRTKQRLHQVIARRMGITEAPDHADRNGLNNSRSNLRPASAIEQRVNRGLQSSNTSGFVGVTWDKARGKWRAQLGIYGKGHHLGRFATPVGAALARDRASLATFGEFAFLNFCVDPRTEAIIAGCRP